MQVVIKKRKPYVQPWTYKKTKTRDKMDKRDIVNHNEKQAFGRVHPVAIAKIELGERFAIVEHRGEKLMKLDGKFLCGTDKYTIIMRAVNECLKNRGEPQIEYDKAWLV